MIILQKIKEHWDAVQKIFDIDGDVYLGIFTLAIIFRLVLAGYGRAPINMAEAAAYGSAIGAFAYSNRGPRC